MIFLWTAKSNFKIGALRIFGLFVVNAPKTLVVVKVGHFCRTGRARLYLSLDCRRLFADNVDREAVSVLPVTGIDRIISV